MNEGGIMLAGTSTKPTCAGKVFVVLGASGRLAKKVIYPALWELFQQHQLPDHVRIVGYSRSKLSTRDLKNRCRDFCTGIGTERGKLRYDKFWRLHKYVAGEYENDNDKGAALTRVLEDFEKNCSQCDRIFYLAVPASVYEPLSYRIAESWKAPKGNTKLALEKPFGVNIESMKKLQDLLAKSFVESEICRLDHYLCLDMVDSIISLRFANKFFQAVWNKNHISGVMISFKEDLGVQGYAKAFDKVGIIRDIVQNHMLQVLALVAMEEPESSSNEFISLEKVKLLRAVRHIKENDVVLGQYVGKKDALRHDDDKNDYVNDPDVSNHSRTPTFATIVLHIDNERWEGVPFIIRCGKALNEVKDEVRLQFRHISTRTKQLFPTKDVERNEIVIQFRPAEKICQRISVQNAGFETTMENGEIDLSYGLKYSRLRCMSTYQRIIQSLLSNPSNAHYIGREELTLCTQLCETLSRKLSNSYRCPIPYEYGSLGPTEADKLCQTYGLSPSFQHPW